MGLAAQHLLLVESLEDGPVHAVLHSLLFTPHFLGNWGLQTGQGQAQPLPCIKGSAPGLSAAFNQSYCHWSLLGSCRGLFLCCYFPETWVWPHVMQKSDWAMALPHWPMERFSSQGLVQLPAGCRWTEWLSNWGQTVWQGGPCHGSCSKGQQIRLATLITPVQIASKT